MNRMRCCRTSHALGVTALVVVAVSYCCPALAADAYAAVTVTAIDAINQEFLPLPPTGTSNIRAPSELSPLGANSFAVLLVADEFSEVATGKAGRLVTALRRLSRESAADTAFKSLLKHATPAGKLYALCGLYYSDHEFFLRAVEPFKTSTERVKRPMGCDIDNTDMVSSVVYSDRPDTVRLTSPTQSAGEWAKRSGLPSIRFDIVGGAYPSVFRMGYRYPPQ